jgi:hypothetical protein
MGVLPTEVNIMEKYGTHRCEGCDSCDLKVKAESHEKTAELEKTGQVKYECKDCGKTCIKPAF